jgi:hypothetical protein
MAFVMAPIKMDDVGDYLPITILGERQVYVSFRTVDDNYDLGEVPKVTLSFCPALLAFAEVPVPPSLKSGVFVARRLHPKSRPVLERR